MTASSALPGPLLVDAHVHLHAGVDARTFLDAAARNFERAAAALGVAGPPLGVLLFTESAGDDAHARLRAGAASAGPFELDPRPEPESILVRGDGQPRLLLVAGRQVVTREALEVLALATTARFPDGLPIRDTLDAVRAAGALAVVPWGFGKWWFGRGRLVARLVDEADPAEFFLGDNGGRPHLAPAPAAFGRAARRGVRVLPGTDPLPLAGHADRAGSYGFRLDAALDPDRPARDLRACLADPRASLAVYGRGEGLLSFVRNQAGMQWRKRTRRAAA